MNEALDLPDESAAVDDWRDDLPELATPLELDTAELDRQLREAQRLLGDTSARQAGHRSSVTASSGPQTFQHTAQRQHYVEQQHGVATPQGMHTAGVRGYAAQSARGAGGMTVGKQLQAFIAWTSMCIGLAAFACGALLLFWAVYRERPELWELGLPIGLGGQVALLLGVCLQLERLWQENRQAAQRLVEMDRQLTELERNTRLFGTPYHSASQTFYSHLSEGASPHLLLTDLKSQLDLLALRMSQEQQPRR